MPRSKKGRLSGSARKEINGKRTDDAVAVALMSEAERARKGKVLDFVFGRITKHTGANHVRASIATKRGQRELIVRIPNMFTRRGATPITTRSVVTIYVGDEFDPDVRSESGTEHFDLTSVLTERQSNELKKAGIIPDWMMGVDTDGSGTIAEEVGFEWDDSASVEDGEEPAAGGGAAAVSATGFSRGAARKAASGADEEINIDEI